LFVPKQLLGHDGKPTSTDGSVERRVVDLPRLCTLEATKFPKNAVALPHFVVRGGHWHREPIERVSVVPADMLIALLPLRRPFPGCVEQVVAVLGDGCRHSSFDIRSVAVLWSLGGRFMVARWLFGGRSVAV